MHTVFALLCFVVVIHWLIFQYPSGLLHWHCGNLTIAPVSAKQPWWIWINTSCEFIMNDCVTTTKLSTTKPCAYFLGYIVRRRINLAPCRYWIHHYLTTCLLGNALVCGPQTSNLTVVDKALGISDAASLLGIGRWCLRYISANRMALLR